MTDTLRTQADLLQNVFADDQPAGSTRAQAMRDLVVSLAGADAQQQAASYTLVLADAGRVVEVTAGTTVDVTVPPNSSVAFQIGTVIEICQIGAGSVALLPGAGVTLDTPTSTLVSRAQFSTIGLRKRGTDEWLVSGDLA